MRYPNVKQAIGVVVSNRMATLHELYTVYSVEDCYNLIEIIAVDNANRRMAQRLSERMRGR